MIVGLSVCVLFVIIVGCLLVCSVSFVVVCWLLLFLLYGV